jgi:hypothetical protein
MVHRLYLQEIKTEDLDKLLKLQQLQRVEKKKQSSIEKPKRDNYGT